jgi:hypothetical protein
MRTQESSQQKWMFMSWPSKLSKFLVNTSQILYTLDRKPVEVWEVQHRDDESILSAWATHIRNQYCLDTMIDSLRIGYGYTRSEYLLNLKFPDVREAPGPSIRAGDFGEILVADYLEFILEYWVPRTRYVNKTIRNESTKGCDIIGFRCTNPEDRSPEDVLAIFEAKTRFSSPDETSLLRVAVEGSKKDQARKAESLNAIKQRLLIEQKSEDAEKVTRFQNIEDRPCKEIYGAAALFSSSCYEENIACSIKVDDHPKSDHLVLLIIRGHDMMQLVHHLYARAANEA